MCDEHQTLFWLWLALRAADQCGDRYCLSEELHREGYTWGWLG